MPQYKFDLSVAPSHVAKNDNLPCRSKFETLMTPHDWAALPKSVQARFTQKPNAPAIRLYRGYVVYTRRNFFGGLLANCLRIIGAPLPLDTDNSDADAVVTVTPGSNGEGQVWTRHYARRARFPQIIQSAKRFSGPTGLEEYIGYGVGMSLKLRVEDSVLLFKSDHYFFKLGRFKLRLPTWVSPGDLIVSHADHGEGWFEFGLNLTHRIFGTLFDQSIMFQDVEPL